MTKLKGCELSMHPFCSLPKRHLGFLYEGKICQLKQPARGHLANKILLHGEKLAAMKQLGSTQCNVWYEYTQAKIGIVQRNHPGKNVLFKTTYLLIIIYPFQQFLAISHCSYLLPSSTSHSTGKTREVAATNSYHRRNKPLLLSSTRKPSLENPYPQGLNAEK